MDLKAPSDLTAVIGLATTALTVLGTITTALLSRLNKSTDWQNEELKKQSAELGQMNGRIGAMMDHVNETRVSTALLTGQMADARREQADLQKDMNVAFERLRAIETELLGRGDK